MRSSFTAFAVASLLFACKALAGGEASTEVSGAAVGAVAAQTAQEKRVGARRDPSRAQASTPPRTAEPPVGPAERSAHGADVVEPPTQPAQDTGPTCCCRFFSQGWQHAWRTQGTCESSGGACVAPDRCQS
jgi:hypothetical protein